MTIHGQAYTNEAANVHSKGETLGQGEEIYSSITAEQPEGYFTVGRPLALMATVDSRDAEQARQIPRNIDSSYSLQERKLGLSRPKFHILVHELSQMA